MQVLLEQAKAYSAPEVIAVATAVLYLLLAIRQNIWCWLFAGVSTLIYVWLFFGARLYMESALNGFYFAMAAYGWYAWYSGRSGGHELPVSRWPLSVHGLAMVAVLSISGTSGYLLDRLREVVLGR